MKGKYGKVGAPPKNTTWPVAPFSTETLFSRNTNQCELSLRNKVDARLLDGSLIQLKSKKQKGGTVGRPKSMFILKTKFNAAKHVRLDAKTKTTKTAAVKTTKTTKTAKNHRRVVVSIVTPTVAPTPHAPIVVTEPPLATPVAASIPATMEPPVETVETVVIAPEVTAPVAVSPEPAVS